MGPENPTPALCAAVIPTVGRPSLTRTLRALLSDADAARDALTEIVVVDDRVAPESTLDLSEAAGPRAAVPVRVLTSGGCGPAVARNVGWRATSAPWVVFLDDDVVPRPGWARALVRDVAHLPRHVGGSQGIVDVPIPAGRRPTDGELATATLATARWITADMAYRRSVLTVVGGFDETFPRAYREDTDLALRVMDRGYRLLHGERVVTHPSRGSARWASLAAQRGNADDAVMRHRHGAGWRDRVGQPRGRFRRHLVTTSALGLAGGALVRALSHPRRRAPATAVAGAAGAVWLALTAEFALHRIMRASRTVPESLELALTSVAIPPVACWYRLRGELRTRPARRHRLPAAVLFDRDGTLVRDVAYNGDPDLVEPLAGAREALDRLRRSGVPVGVISNQSGIARGMFSLADLDRVNARLEELLGPFDVWRLCVHDENDDCPCRKPKPGLVHDAAASLGVAAARCVVIGDTGGDVAAATAAGARAILVPNGRTRREERSAAPEVADTLTEAVRRVLPEVRR